MRSLITAQIQIQHSEARSENGYGFQRPGLKTGVENGMFWSEIGSGFGEPGGTPQPIIPRSTHTGPLGYQKHAPNIRWNPVPPESWKTRGKMAVVMRVKGG